MNTSRPEPVRVARWCAGRGWPVFPLTPGAKVPMPGCGRCRHTSSTYEPHPPAGCPCLEAGRWCHGFYAATLNSARITRWWADGRRGVGVSTGPARLVIIDADRHTTTPPAHTDLLPGTVLTQQETASVRDGVDVLRLLARHGGQPDPTSGSLTLTVGTPSGGLHLWFRAPARTRWHSSNGGDHRGRRLGWQLDVRSNGGLVVAPGTTTEAGTYRVLGAAREPALLPSWLAGHLTATGHLLDEPAPAQAGEAKVPNRARAAAARAAAHHQADGGAGGQRWAQQTTATMLAAVADCGRLPEGAGWSAAVNRAAYTLGGLVAGGHITEPAAHTVLLEAALGARPAKRAAALGIIRSGLTAGARRALHPKDHR